MSEFDKSGEYREWDSAYWNRQMEDKSSQPISDRDFINELSKASILALGFAGAWAAIYHPEFFDLSSHNILAESLSNFHKMFSMDGRFKLYP